MASGVGVASGEGLTSLLAQKRGSAAQVLRVHICDNLSELAPALALSPQALALRLKVPVPVFARGAVVASGKWLISLQAPAMKAMHRVTP